MTWCAGAAWLLLAAVGQAADKLVLLDGSAFQDTVAAIDAQGAVRCQGRPQAVDLQGLRRIERAALASPAPAPCDVHLATGGVLHAQSVSFDGQILSLKWPYGNSLALPLALVRAVRLNAAPGEAPGAMPHAFEASIAEEELRLDELFAITEGTVQAIRGGLQAIAGGEVRFIWNDAERKVPRAKVYGLVLAHRSGPPDHTGQCLVHLKDGSSLWAFVKGMESGRLTLEVAAKLELAVPWDAVCRLAVRSSRCAFLSDLDPIEVVEEPLVTFAGPWQRDRSVLDQPLTLGKTVYEKGLGVHSRCRLSYALDGRYDLFAATIGIDASAAGKGNCVFAVLADGKELFRKAMRGTDGPADVRLKVANALRLTLLVDWGEDLDLADRANWCDARVIREAK
ncbi:MAG TPA: NPCBM/NEW2 domain-containing protein [Planctomycetota bacterium]|nr:NPCBM/NEW2 domain-containing protein [Planctomycetota bacterium]